jgi:uncharacterized delta-60 repeat protein
VEALEDRLLLSGPGDLDPTFGTGGEVLGTFSSGAHPVKIQADGKIVVGGQGNGAFALARYNAVDGSLDPTFGSGGKVTTGVSGSGGCDYQLVLYPSSDPVNGGKILAVGDLYISGGKHGTTHYNLARYNPNGSLDTTFGSGGFATCPIHFSNGGNSGVLLQADDKILVAGSVSSSTAYTAALARFNANGSPDSTFGSGGTVIMTVGTLGNSWYYGAGLETVGTQTKIVVAGQTYNTNPYNHEQMVVARYNLNGTLDTTFNATGPQPGLEITEVVTGTAPGRAIAAAVVVQPDNKIVTTGYVFNAAGTKDFGVARYNPDGGLDTSFGSGGITTLSIAQSAFPYGMALQGDGKIVVCGDVHDPSSGTGSFGDTTVARFNADGTTDTSFSSVGANTIDYAPGSVTIPTNGGVAYSVALQTLVVNGVTQTRIVTAGFYNSNTAESWAVFRFLGDAPSALASPAVAAAAASSSSVPGALNGLQASAPTLLLFSAGAEAAPFVADAGSGRRAETRPVAPELLGTASPGADARTAQLAVLPRSPLSEALDRIFADLGSDGLPDAPPGAPSGYRWLSPDDWLPGQGLEASSVRIAKRTRGGR